MIHAAVASFLYPTLHMNNFAFLLGFQKQQMLFCKKYETLLLLYHLCSA